MIQPANKKIRRQTRIRAKIHGTISRPRLSVHRSNVSMYAQLIDDTARKTILSISEKELASEAKLTKSERAKALGVSLAKKALEKKIKAVIFDKGAYAYHGRVKALAEGAREGGLSF